MGDRVSVRHLPYPPRFYRPAMIHLLKLLEGVWVSSGRESRYIVHVGIFKAKSIDLEYISNTYLFEQLRPTSPVEEKGRKDQSVAFDSDVCRGSKRRCLPKSMPEGLGLIIIVSIPPAPTGSFAVDKTVDEP